MTEELKPCPFCGGKAELLVTGTYWYRCTDCGAETECDPDKNSAASLWNRRSSSIGTLKVNLSILDTEPMSELVEIICDHRDDMPPEMREKFAAWVEKHTTDKE